MSAVVSVSEARRSRVRLFIVTMLFLVTTVNYADRATLSIAGPALSKELGLDPIAMGYIFSAFGWSYVAAQVPGGWLLDRYGSRWVYAFSIMIWSLFTLAAGLCRLLRRRRRRHAAVPAAACGRLCRGAVVSRPMRASSRRGFPAMSAARRRPSSIPGSISRP